MPSPHEPHHGGVRRWTRSQQPPHSGSRRPAASALPHTGQKAGKTRSRSAQSQTLHAGGAGAGATAGRWSSERMRDIDQASRRPRRLASAIPRRECVHRSRRETARWPPGCGERNAEMKPGEAARRAASMPRGSVCGGALLFLHRALALDAISRERKGFQSLLGDGLTAALAIAESSLVDLLERRNHFLQQAPIPVAELEKELPIVGGRRLVSEVLDGVVLGALAVQDVLPHLVHELLILLLELLAEVGQAFLSHRRLLRRAALQARIRRAG